LKEGQDLIFEQTLLSIGDAVMVADLEGRITLINPAAEKLTGWSKSDALDKQLTDIFRVKAVNEQSVETESRVAKAVRDGAVNGVAARGVLIARDGSELPISKSSTAVVDAGGRSIGVVLVFRDISNVWKAERELEGSETRYRRLFESAHDGILILDEATAKVTDVNPFMSLLLGYPRDYFLGKELWEIGVFRDAAASREAMETLKKAGKIRYEDRPLQHKDGRHIPVEFVSNVYREGPRKVIQCNIRDITERKRLAEELVAMKEKAEVANRAKSQFLANMSHEIRTPLTAILGFAEMQLRKSPEECAKIGCSEIIRRNSVHLLELINDILDLSKVEAGEMKVERVFFDLPALFSEIISLLRPRAKEKGLGFGVTFQGPIPRTIQSDPSRLRQILINLMGNALKFTESGNIDLLITAPGTGDGTMALRVDVTDSGIGMTAELMGRLFRPFTQGDESITRKFGGTGLGLTISQEFARLLGGGVTVTSQPGVGSTFSLKINAGPSLGVEQLEGLTETMLPRKADQAFSPEIYLRGRILLVEDGADNQRLFRMQLNSSGASVVSAMNGQMAVDLATSQPFDLILMDMQMPVMDGYAATTELRRRGLKIPIIALTAYAMEEDRARCLTIGCDAYLSKPVEEQTLLTAVHRYLGQPVPAESGEASAGGAAPIAAPAAAAGPDSEPIKSSLSGDPRMREIIPGFVGRLPGKVRKMLDLMEQHDLPALQNVVHELLGTGGGYGFPAVSESARQAQESIRGGGTFETITSEVNSLIAIIRRIEGYKEVKSSERNERGAEVGAKQV
jgi:PAS domain S-box-containing protein